MVLWRSTGPSRNNTKKRFHYMVLECNRRKSRDTWSKGKSGLGIQNEAGKRLTENRALPRECTAHSKHPLPTTQEKTLHMDITRWSTLKSDWLYSLQPKIEKLYTVKKKKKRLGADCVSDHEPLSAKLRLKLKEIGKINGPFRYDLMIIQWKWEIDLRA